MGQSGRKTEWTSAIDAGQFAAIEAAVDSEAREAAASIYRRFGLATANVSPRTFAYWVATRRKRQRTARLETALPAGEAPSWEEIDRRARQAMLRALDAGDTRVYELALLSRSRREQDRLELDRKVDARAAEIHDVKMRQLAKELRTAVEGATEGGKAATRQELFDRIDSIMRSV